VKDEMKTIGTGDMHTSVMLLRRCRLCDKLSVLFKTCHARPFHSHFL